MSRHPLSNAGMFGAALGQPLVGDNITNAQLEAAITGSAMYNSAYPAVMQQAKYTNHSEALMEHTIFEAKVQVIRAANGFIVSVADKPGAVAKLSIASTMDEVRDLIVSHMVAAKLDK